MKESNLLLDGRCCCTSVAHPDISEMGQRKATLGKRGRGLLDEAFCPEKRQMGASVPSPRSSPAMQSREGFSARQLFLGRKTSRKGDERLCAALVSL